MQGRISLQPPDRNGAEAVAVAALSFLGSRPEDLSRFVALTGVAPDSIRRHAEDPSFLGGVLDYLLGDEPLLVAFAAEAGLTPEAVVAAHRCLSGPDAG